MNYETNNNDSNNTTVRRTSSRNNINNVADNNINNNSDKRNCSICLASYDIGDNIRTIPCLHYFHKDCIDTWLKSNSACPICKYSCNANEGL
jgi:E3 ubiquitin-protein ligase DOA10